MAEIHPRANLPCCWTLRYRRAPRRKAEKCELDGWLDRVHRFRNFRSQDKTCAPCDRGCQGSFHPSIYVKVSVAVLRYYDWNWSRVTYVGNRRATIIPALQVVVGKYVVCGSRVFTSSRHVYVSWRNLAICSSVFPLTSPIYIRNPYISQPRRILLTSLPHYTYRLERSNLGGLLKVVETVLHIVDCHSTIGSLKPTVGELWNALIGSIASFEVSPWTHQRHIDTILKWYIRLTERRSNS